MHELAITQSILNIALEEAAKHQARQVLAIRIKAGAYCGVLPPLVQEYFAIISAGTPAAVARLEIESVPARARCRACGAESELERLKIYCSACGGRDLELLSGREFYVASLELE